jgi:hypothetical protein
MKVGEIAWLIGAIIIAGILLRDSRGVAAIIEAFNKVLKSITGLTN